MARTLELVVEAEGHSRLDRYLMSRLPGESRASVQRLITAGLVSLEGRPLKASARIRSGDRIRVQIPDPLPARLGAEPIPLEIVHEDPLFLVVAKPPGMVVHPGAGRRTGTLVNALLARGEGFSRVGGEERPGIVHRLDRETSGLLVVARNDAAHRHLSAQFAARSVTKLYLALAWGEMVPAHGRIDAPLGRHPVARTRMAVRNHDGRAAMTEYESLERLDLFTLLGVRILTGRTHQIRVHLKHRGHPVVGDAAYGGDRFNAVRQTEIREALEAFGRLALHAHRLEFRHPETDRPLCFEAPLPADFSLLLEKLRRDS